MVPGNGPSKKETIVFQHIPTSNHPFSGAFAVSNQCLLFLELLFSHKCWDFSPKKWGPTVSWWTWGANDCCEIHAFFTAPMSMGGRGASFTLFGLMESTNCVFEMGRIAFVWREPYQLLVSFVNQCLGKTITGSFLTLCFEHIFVGEKNIISVCEVNKRCWNTTNFHPLYQARWRHGSRYVSVEGLKRPFGHWFCWLIMANPCHQKIV